MALALFVVTFAALLSGYPVALTLAGISLLFAFGGVLTGAFNPADLGFLPNRLFGIMTNQTMIAVPLFVFMGVVLEKTRIAENLLGSLSAMMQHRPGGLALAVVIVGMLMAASTGIVGATVVTLGLMALPAMLRDGYAPALATGTVAATGTLGQIIPPSIALVLLGDVLANAYQQAQLDAGVFAPDTVSVGDLFAGALLPGLLLVAFYLVYVFVSSRRTSTESHKAVSDGNTPAPRRSDKAADTMAEAQGASPASSSRQSLIANLIPPLLLILLVLGSILGGIATPTEAAGVGAMGALVLALWRRRREADVMSFARLREVCQQTLSTTAMVFFILIGASLFSLVFRGYGGDELVAGWFDALPGGTAGALLVVMLVIFLLGFMLDFIEITFVVVPIVAPILLAMGVDPVWLGVLIAVNLQTSFLTPPFGFALFYLRGVTPPEVPTTAIYRGVIPFVALQLLLLVTLVIWPALATWLPEQLYG
ncbi:MAG: TRAP transporter large permease subunit [Pseudomonadota bacterium]